jgi:hypothetical protein
MPRAYSPEAIAEAQRLYLLFNGKQHDRIEQEMRKKWPGWSKQNLHTRGSGRDQKIGWIDKYGFDEALRIHLATRPEGLRTSAEQAFHEIEEIRKRLYEEIKTLGANASSDLVYQHRDYSKLFMEAETKLHGANNTLANFVAMWERLLEWLPAFSEAALGELLKVADKVLEKAALEYGETETVGSRTT